MQEKVFMGIDGGGTYTRVAIANEEGIILSHVKWNGGAHVRKNATAKVNVHQAIMSALEHANCAVEDVCALGAGIAGYDSEEDLKKINELTEIPGLSCAKKHANDAVVAHVGALLGQPGILAISGSGSIVYGITEKGEHIRNYDFNHRSKTGAQHLTFAFVHRVLAGDIDETDDEIVQALLKHFKVKNIPELAWLGAAGFENAYDKRKELFGSFAKSITDAAISNSNLAKAVCEQAALNLSTGIKMVGACFESDAINVALTGSVANSKYIKERIGKRLLSARNKSFILSEPVLQPEFGAIVMAMREMNIS